MSIYAEIPVTIILKTNGDVLYKISSDIEIGDTVVPSGFISDGATSPKFIWWLLPPVSRYFTAAIGHDYLLSIGTDWREAEAQFKKFLKICGMKSWVVFLMVNAVRLHGLVTGQRKI